MRQGPDSYNTNEPFVRAETRGGDGVVSSDESGKRRNELSSLRSFSISPKLKKLVLVLFVVNSWMRHILYDISLEGLCMTSMAEALDNQVKTNVSIKLVQKSFARLVFDDVARNANSVDESAKEKLGQFTSLKGDESYQSRDLEKASQQVAKPDYDRKVQPGTLIPMQLGNMESWRREVEILEFVTLFSKFLFCSTTLVIRSYHSRKRFDEFQECSNESSRTDILTVWDTEDKALGERAPWLVH
ncbi:hypothetical protein L6452_16881 [Arctium lappa]|uniref:Uncharacterized protein n=1 Tax=Arctium lappa TaxID=4217 RepID=A0ACB9C1X1_ARCLA|nr:hypothetical protein L6452_16881 [Arctium lappa]